MFHATELYGQNARLFRTEPCRPLTLILACIVYWQAREIWIKGVVSAPVPFPRRITLPSALRLPLSLRQGR